MSNELKSASSVKTGKKFSEKRNNIGFTIEEISEKLFINKDYISAIEKGNYSIFPSESFAKAYFNKYKNFLKISPEFPNLFDQKIEKKHKKISNEIAFENNFDFIFNNLYVIIALALMVIFGIYYFVNRLTIFSHNIKLWVSFSPWRISFSSNAGFPLFRPPRKNAILFICLFWTPGPLLFIFKEENFAP